MIITHNLPALNSWNRLNQNNKSVSNSFEKLSSGYRINKAADDAAGLAISEKMRAQIRGLQKSQQNIQDGISLIQTVEGALGSIGNPSLIRLRELAIQAANDTLTDEDRKHIQKEVDQIKQHIDAVANNTEFNTIKLLNREMKAKVVEAGTITTIPGYYEATPSVVDLSKVTSITTFEMTLSTVLEETFPLAELVSGKAWTPHPGSSESYVFSVNLADNTFTTTALRATGSVFNNITGVRLNGVTGYEDTEMWAAEIVRRTGGVVLEDIGNILGSDLSDHPSFGGPATSDKFITVNFKSRKYIPEKVITTLPKTVQVPDSLKIHTGANEGQNLEVELTDVRVKALGIDNLDYTTRSGADEAIGVIDAAIEKVSAKRSMYGAYQNRLEYAYNQSTSYEENLTAAESRIRDTDIAKESMQLVKNQILVQSAQSMLAQSNQRAEGVFNLLQ